MAQLLVDVTPFKSVLRESKEKPGTFEVEGVMQRAKAENQNGRVYSKDILVREAKKYVDEFVKRGNAFGELDHPESPVVSLKNASHIITEARMDGDVCYGTVEILDTPSGQILKSLVDSGVTLGISSRGVGSTRHEGGNQVVQDDFQLICFDIVLKSNAFVELCGIRYITPTFDTSNLVVSWYN